MFFEQVYVVGSGSICINIVKSLVSKGISPIVLMYREHNLSPLSIFVSSKNIEHKSFSDKKEMSDYLIKIEKSSLLISANNIFLFPKEVVAKDNLKIVNFHNALLPAHRGMNAPTWVIYEQDKIAGITWHLVNENIDDGNIIIQKSIDLDNSETALCLIRKLMNLAFDAYKQIENDLLDWTVKATPMPKMDVYQIHYSKDVPNNGMLDLSWSLSKMSAFLRALDWGCVEQFVKPVVEINNRQLTIEKYKIMKDEQIDLLTNGGVFVINNEGFTLTD